MRLSKRIAACVLTAAMALTMMAGCASTQAPAPNPGNGGNNSSSSTTNNGNNNNNNGNSNSNGSNSNNGNSEMNGGSDVTKPDVSVSAWQKSRTYQYVKLLNGEEVSIDADWTFKEPNQTVVMQYIYEKYGEGNVYMNAISGNEWRKALLQNGAYYYTDQSGSLDNGKWLYIKSEVDDFEQQEYADAVALPKELLTQVLSPTKPNSIQSGTKQMGASVYDTESFERLIDGDKYQVDCYFIGTTLKYIICDSSTERVTIRINKLTNRANSSYFRIPSNGVICIMDKYGNLYDENHNYLGKYNG